MDERLLESKLIIRLSHIKKMYMLKLFILTFYECLVTKDSSTEHECSTLSTALKRYDVILITHRYNVLYKASDVRRI